MSPEPASLCERIRPGRVHRSLYTDPEIFALELERIFGRAWIYVGHESQVPQAGDYVQTRIGLKPLLLVRGEDGACCTINAPIAARGWSRPNRAMRASSAAAITAGPIAPTGGSNRRRY